MKKIIIALLLLIIGISLNANAESAHIKEFKQRMEIEKQVFIHDDIYLDSYKKNTLSKFKNCQEYLRPNWSYICKGEKTYLFAFKDDALKRYQINSKVSADEKNKLIASLNKVYGPPSIIEQSVERPYEGHLSIKPYISDPNWHSSEPHIYTWKESLNLHESENIKKLTLHTWPTADPAIVGLSLTVSKGDMYFYEEYEAVKFDKFILDKETDLELGLNKSLHGLLFLALVLLFRRAARVNSEDSNVKKIMEGLRNVVVVELIILFVINGGALSSGFNLHPLGFIVLITVSAITGWVLAVKKI
jgi:hypothetical protein